MNDAELIAGLQAGEEDAYRTLMSTYGRALHGYLWRLTGDPHVSEDILGETLLQVVEHIATYTYRGVPLRRWLYRIAYNCAVNTMRERRHSVSLDMHAELPLTDPSTDPSTTVVQTALLEAVVTALGQLTPSQRQVVVLRFGAHLPLRDIGNVLGKTENTVKQLSFRAFNTLARHLRAWE